MVKHLFRVNYVNPTNDWEEGLVEKTESFRETDEVLREHIPVHILDIPVSKAAEGSIDIYGRDVITEWGENLYVNPNILGGWFKHFLIIA